MLLKGVEDLKKKSVKDIDLHGKKVIMRVDFNVPMDKAGNITDDNRIQAALPTIRYILQQNAAVILMAHLGRPKGSVKPEFSLKPVASALSNLLSLEVQFAGDCIGEAAEQAAEKLQPGQVLLLENLRFYPQEEKNDLEFAGKLAKLADIYVNDGFGVSHRAHASVDGIARLMPAVAGLLLEKEIAFVGGAVSNPQHPFAAIIGGAKVSDKIGVIENLLTKVDTLIIGGGMANTFLAAQGCQLGKSLIEPEKIELAAQLIEHAKQRKVNLMLPVDVVVADRFAADAEYKVVEVKQVPADWMVLDIGPRTQQLFAQALTAMKTIVWNGPMGVFEFDSFAKGTEAVAKAVAESGAVSIVGGGDSTAALEKTGMAEKVSHISTGGGASLEYLEGKILPGIAALNDLRKPVIAGNWKMHKTVEQSVLLIKELIPLTERTNHADIVVCPVFTSLYAVGREIKGTNIRLGAQDVYWEPQGAYTGEISPAMLQDTGCSYVIIGHSERRQYFGESDETVNKKVKAAMAEGLLPIVCVGESLSQREAGELYDFIAQQIRGAFAGIDAVQSASIIVAYEPIWAIGTGKTATAQQANDMCAFIRGVLDECYDGACARQIRILYGGSVKPQNIQELMGQSDIDGALVGGASLEAATFAGIANY